AWPRVSPADEVSTTKRVSQIKDGLTKVLLMGYAVCIFPYTFAMLHISLLKDHASYG
ncbi:unnamed protein product, partial [Dovyalis caffra]